MQTGVLTKQKNSSPFGRTTTIDSEQVYLFKLVLLFEFHLTIHMLYSASRNGPIYAKMEALLKELEVTRTAEEIKNRIKSLESKFRYYLLLLRF